MIVRPEVVNLFFVYLGSLLYYIVKLGIHYVEKCANSWNLMLEWVLLYHENGYLFSLELMNIIIENISHSWIKYDSSGMHEGWFIKGMSPLP